MSLEANWTTTAFCAGAVQVTVPAPVSTPAFSLALAGRLTESTAVRSSWRVSVAMPGVYPAAVVVISDRLPDRITAHCR